MDRFNWYNPLKETLDLKSQEKSSFDNFKTCLECALKMETWKHEESLKVGKNEINQRLKKISNEVEAGKWMVMKKIAAFV